ncbi:MAG: FHA domain-containing protein [Myxococcaceae bacterium]|nr:FHA domain-containing protein [Myxococcaceae bacterium]
MPYSLTVTNDGSGPAGRGKKPEFVFDSEEARLGRTADNDIVVKDPNASRKHCRVFPKDGKFWLEDLGSANGTAWNGTTLHGTTVELKHGDKISIGEVTFGFAIQSTPSAEVPVYDFDFGDTVVRGGYGAKTVDPDAGVVQTSLTPAFDPHEVLRERERSTRRSPGAAKAPAPAPKPAGDPSKTADLDDEPAQPIHENVDATDPVRAMTNLIPQQAAKPLHRTMTDEVPAPAGAIVVTPAEPVAPVAVAAASPAAAPVAQPAESDRVRRGKDKTQDEDSQVAEPTAADKLRVRRQANKTTMGRLTYAFGQLPRGLRIAAISVTLASLAGLGFVVVWLFAPAPKRVLPAEPVELVNLGPIIEYSFGAGDAVDYERTDLKTFSFKVTTPTRAVGLLHYHARDVGKDEVALSVNGYDLGFVPPDTTNTADRDLDLVLPAGQLKRNELNQLTFDNVKNPPGKDGWAVWSLWLQLMPLPDISVEETPVAAKEDLDRAQKFFDLREIGPDALFNAWRAYRDAWLKLESMPGRPNDLYAVARGQQTETWRLLDRRCKLMQIDVQRALTKTTPDYDTARIVLNDMLRYFPTREHPCHNLVKSLLEQLDPTTAQGE